MKNSHNQVILEIKDSDLGIQQDLNVAIDYVSRKAARGIVLKEGKIALMHVSKLGFYKLPGGGVENGEDAEQAFVREIKEEVGVNCTITSYLGSIVEYREQFQLIQTNYVYVSDFVNDLANNNLTEEEKENGFNIIWTTLEEAINYLKQSDQSDYESKFIIKRDLAILHAYKQI